MNKESGLPLSRRRALGLAASAALGLTGRVGRVAAAEANWPTKPIKFILPFPSGGGADTAIRLLSQALGDALGQSVYVEFMPGANGNIGTAYVARQAPDGYTLLLDPGSPMVQNLMIYKNVPYDPAHDFTPIGKVGYSPMPEIVVNPKLGVRTLKELVAYAKANPGKLSVSNAGIGAVNHLSSVLFEQVTGTTINKIPYNSGKRVSDLLGGQIDMAIDQPGGYLPHVAAGSLVAIAVLANERFAPLPDVPTTVESGYPELVAEGWYGVYGPRGMDPGVVSRLNKILVDYLQTADGKRKLLEQCAIVATPSTPAGLEAYIGQETKKWGPIISNAKISVD